MVQGIGVSTARQHVVQAEHHVAHQRRIVEELVRRKHLRQADMAQRVLHTLEDSLKLAQEHLAREEEKAGVAVRR